jgi:hypothetical protein
VSETRNPEPETRNTYDPLVEFAKWCVAQPGMMVPRSPAFGVTRVGQFSGLVLYRSGQFQAQLWIADPNSEIPDHRHPNVDQIQVYVSGEVYLRKNGVCVITPESLQQLADGTSNANGAGLRVGPADTHGATVGEMGGAFLNFQHWLKGTPQSGDEDWIGEPLDAEHAIAIGAR